MSATHLILSAAASAEMVREGFILIFQLALTQQVAQIRASLNATPGKDVQRSAWAAVVFDR